MNKDTMMLAKLTIGRWTGRKYDREVSSKLNDSEAANHDASRVNKLLVPKHVFKPINKAYNLLYSTHIQWTLPWGDDESRILPAKSYLGYMDRLRGAKDHYDTASDEFANRYPDLIQQARSWLGTMYRLEDYPDPGIIRDKFYVDLYIHQLPQASDFRVDLADDEVARIRKSIETRTQESVNQAMVSLWERVYSVVQRFSDTLSEPDKRFHHTMLSQALELVSILPALNITNDPNLTRIQNEIQRSLANADIKGLREDNAYRKTTAEKADDIMQAMRTYMGDNN